MQHVPRVTFVPRIGDQATNLGRSGRDSIGQGGIGATCATRKLYVRLLIFLRWVLFSFLVLLPGTQQQRRSR